MGIQQKPLQQIQETTPKRVRTQPDQSQEMLEMIEKLEQQCLDLKQQIQVLTKFKKMVKNCDQISCKGCKKLFKPLVFQVHALKCLKLKEEVGEEDTDRLSIKITCKEKDTCNAIVVVAGMRWLAKFSFQDFSGKLLEHLQSEFPQAEVMRGKALTKFRKALQENAPEHEICNTL